MLLTVCDNFARASSRRRTVQVGVRTSVQEEEAAAAAEVQYSHFFQLRTRERQNPQVCTVQGTVE